MNPVYLIYVLIAIVGLIILWAYVRCFFKRLRCLVMLRLTCRRLGFAVRVKHPLWFLGSRYARRYDLAIRTPQGTFAVKLFGCLWPLKVLILREYGEYIFRGFSTYLKFILNFIDSWQHPLPSYRLMKKQSALAGDGALRPILLVNPMPMEIRFQPNNGQEEISGTGDMICGMEIASLSHLLRVLEGAAE